VSSSVAGKNPRRKPPTRLWSHEKLDHATHMAPTRHTLWGPGEDMKKPALDLKKPSVTAVDEVSGEGKGA
jgi:hypothetical protein